MLVESYGGRSTSYSNFKAFKRSSHIRHICGIIWPLAKKPLIVIVKNTEKKYCIDL